VLNGLELVPKAFEITATVIAWRLPELDDRDEQRPTSISQIFAECDRPRVVLSNNEPISPRKADRCTRGASGAVREAVVH
jgi:hypothetical protein